jgi:hypothetical protein
VIGAVWSGLAGGPPTPLAVVGAPPETAGLVGVDVVVVVVEEVEEGLEEATEVPPETLPDPRARAAAGATVSRTAKLHSAEPKARTRKTHPLS